MNAMQTTRNGDKLDKATPVGLGGCFAAFNTSLLWWRGNWWRFCPPAAPYALVEVSET